ncbi:hypothetical protein [Ciceribacter thiooxidans]|uniref:Uncharacterized protein n=1 Tax=Ciceribacter thiooxidans TaxID=1969821 RepID=A0ABV7I0X5_9HYPH|nr:hypothetical protein [Ciceribacter thiooxidans]MDI6834674.1 hypothetical protein [Rhizobiaceae bacterium]
MSNEADHFYHRQDRDVQILIAENRGDELTDILVDALYDAFRILRDEAEGETLH